jgi:hypothetical protein
MARFPVHYRPRPYQAILHEMWRSHTIGCAVLPRQSGKDVSMSMEMTEGLLKTPKTTGTYISLDSPMIRDILWDKTYNDPETGQYIRMLQDNVPPGYADWKGTAMEGRFSNGSRLKLQGYFQNGRDKNGVGTSFQRYAFTELALFDREDPLPRLMPIILGEHEEKRLMVASTPRGKHENPLWKLIESMQGNPKFKLITWTIDELNAMMRADGLPPVVSEAQLELTRDQYLKRFGNDRMFEQEYYCSFEDMDAAAVYGEAYMKIIAEKRYHVFNPHPGHPIYVCFDIGASGLQSDATAWIAFQWVNSQLFLFDCGEGHGRALPEYVDVLREKPWFNRIAAMILPWDGDHHEKAVNTTPADMMRQKFPVVNVLAKSNKVWKIPGSRQGDFDLVTDIQQTRMALYNTIIHSDNCQLLMEHMAGYKYEFSAKLQQWSAKPVHDKHSHMMDCLRYIVQATKELDFFGGLHDNGQGSGASSSADYTEDWSSVWRRR